MIWFYIGLILWGVFIAVCAVKGGKRIEEGTSHETFMGWMVPILLTAMAILGTGITLSIHETARLYS